VCCSRCSKVLDRAGPPTCDATATKKCSRCARLHKECKPFPLEFNAQFNSLVRAVERLNADEDDESPEVAAFTTAQREFVKELDAFVRKGVKHGGTRKPKGDELTLLLVKGIDRVGTALEGLLDLARQMVGISPRRFDVVLTSCSKGSLRSALVTRRLTQAPTTQARLLATTLPPLRFALASATPARALLLRRPRNPDTPSRRGRRALVALLRARSRTSRAKAPPLWCRLRSMTRMEVTQEMAVTERRSEFALA